MSRPVTSLARTFAFAAVAAVLGVALSVQAEAVPLPAANIFGVGVDNTIYYVDTGTKTIQSVAPSLSTGVKANGFAVDRSRDVMYYFGSNGDLYFYDLLQGNAGTVAPASTFGNDADFPPEDASFYDGSFWYIGKGDNYDNKLYKAAITYTGNVPSFTGTPQAYQLSASGSTSGMAFGDIAFNNTTGMLYGSTTPASGGLFFSIDSLALSTVGVNPVTVLSSGNAVGLQLAFSADSSVLFGQEYGFNPSDPTNPALTTGTWYTVNTTTGTYTAIAGFTTTPGMRDLAGVSAVPEPGTFLLATVAFAAALAWNRKPKAARAS